MNLVSISLKGGQHVGNIREKELFLGYKLLSTKTHRESVDARFYCARSGGSVVYCIVWISGKGVYGRGVGKAGGYGYDKPSAALNGAMLDAGINISDLGGRGSVVMEEAIRAVGTGLGFDPEELLLVKFAG